MRMKDLQDIEDSNTKETNPFYVSFSDLMVVLSTFFVMLIAMSKIDVGSFEKIKVGFSGSTKDTLVELTEKLQSLAKSQKNVSVELAEDGVRLDIDSVSLFDTASAVIKPGSFTPLRPLLNEILKTKYSLEIEGHTDDRGFYHVKNGEIESNWSLSGRRASSVAHYLLEMGFKPKRLQIVGFADTKPKAKVSRNNASKASKARAINRRVSILVR